MIDVTIVDQKVTILRRRVTTIERTVRRQKTQIDSTQRRVDRVEQQPNTREILDDILRRLEVLESQVNPPSPA